MHVKRRVGDLNFKCEKQQQRNHQYDGAEKGPTSSVVAEHINRDQKQNNAPGYYKSA